MLALQYTYVFYIGRLVELICRKVHGLPILTDQPEQHDRLLNEVSVAFRPSLTRYFARRIKERSDVEDLVQEVFLRLVRRGGLRDVEHVSGYIFETASNVLTDQVRRWRVRQADAQVELRHADDVGTEIRQDRVLEGQQELQRAVTALEQLPEQTRQVFVLRRIEGMQYRDLATRLGISISAAEKHMQRAILHLMTTCGE